MFVRQLHYLLAVAREQHFGRAAESCNVSQPTLSGGLRKLEQELGYPLVIRGHRFLGFTAQGERVLVWAQRIVADYDGLRQDLAGPGAGLSGVLRLGAIPAALPALPALVNAFTAAHPKVRVQIASLTSAAIQRALDELEIDAGITYLDNEPLSRVRSVPLYDETYVFVTLNAEPFSGRKTLSWAEAAQTPLCLLTPDMQNRRIIDQALADAGVTLQPRVEVNSFMGVWAQVASGAWSSIVPHAHLDLFGRISGMRALPLVEPERVQSIGLVITDRDPSPPVAAALLRHARAELQAPAPG